MILRRARRSSLNPSMRGMSFCCAKFGRRRRLNRRPHENRRSARPMAHTRLLKEKWPRPKTGAIGIRPSLTFETHHVQRAREKMPSLLVGEASQALGLHGFAATAFNTVAGSFTNQPFRNAYGVIATG